MDLFSASSATAKLSLKESWRCGTCFLYAFPGRGTKKDRHIKFLTALKVRGIRRLGSQSAAIEELVHATTPLPPLMLKWLSRRIQRDSQEMGTGAKDSLNEEEDTIGIITNLAKHSGAMAGERLGQERAQ
nr:hypothetical protein Iba_scaffold30479CG0010 [Ipomoea batatas]GMC69133.1 hypothetical protein Iba_chr03aCG3840 [Ipomoea batatas]GMD27886.1 hypothetical protein Iba_chr08eCG2130 [Ipomoea batatas]